MVWIENREKYYVLYMESEGRREEDKDTKDTTIMTSPVQ